MGETIEGANGHVWIRERLYQRECTDDLFVRRCSEIQADGTYSFVCDPSGKDKIAWMLSQGISARKARSNLISIRVAAWTTRLNQGSLSITPDSPNLIRECSGLAWAGSRKMVDTERFAPNTPDHAFDAGANTLQELDFGGAAKPLSPKVTMELGI